MLIWSVFGLMCAFVLLCVLSYIKLNALYQTVRLTWNRLDVSLKNRQDLLPTLSLIAAAFDKEDRCFSAELSLLKEKPSLCSCVEKRITAEADISQHVRQLFALAEASNEFKNDEHLHHLRSKLTSLEARIHRCQKRYNAAVQDFNTLAGIFPLNIIVKILEFRPPAYFEFEKSL